MAKFKLPSISYIIENAIASFRRFPFVICSAIFVAIVGCLMVDNELEDFYYINLMLVGAFGVPLFFAIHTFVESKEFTLLKSAGLYIIGLGGLSLLYWMLPENDSTTFTAMPYIRYVIFSLAIHLILSFAPFLKSNINNGFWQFNRSLFVRLFLAQLYAAVLYGGICGALLAIQELFEVDIDEDLYLKLWIIHASVINIWIFVGGIDEKINELNDSYEYPKALKIFAQYILLPIVALYFIILYAYIFKIVVQWDWPKGIVSYLIIGVSALAFLTSLLLYPYGKEEKGTWVEKTRRGIFIAIVPLTVILFIAIGMRISNYGLTINRYLILVVGIWLLLISLFNILKIDSIKSIPISLATVALLITFGPWGMAAVSEKNQVKRLQNYLVEAELFDVKTGKLVQEYEYKTMKPINGDSLNISIPDSTVESIESILQYLDDYHGFDKIEKWFIQDLDSIRMLPSNLNDNGNSDLYEARTLEELMGLSIYHEDKIYFPYKTFTAEGSQGIPLNEYDYLFPGFEKNYRNYSDRNRFEIEGRGFNYELEEDTYQIVIKEENSDLELILELSDFIYELDKLYETGQDNLSVDSMSVKTENSKIEFVLFFKDIRIHRETKTKIEIISYHANLLVRMKD